MGRRIATIGIPLLFVVVIFAGCSSAPVATSSTPTIYRSPQFQWQPDQHTHQISVPTTAQNPGPVITLHARHQLGLGVLITATGSEPLQTAVNTSQQVLNDEILHLRQFGWKALFTPTAEGAYPDYLLYVTLRGGSAYCFIEYSATDLSTTQASQQLDIYYS